MLANDGFDRVDRVTVLREWLQPGHVHKTINIVRYGCKAEGMFVWKMMVKRPFCAASGFQDVIQACCPVSVEMNFAESGVQQGLTGSLTSQDARVCALFWLYRVQFRQNNTP